MSKILGEMPIEELRELLQASWQTLTALVDSLANRPDMENAIRQLMRPDDMLETFSELAVKEPDLMRSGSAGQCCGAGEFAKRGSS